MRGPLASACASAAILFCNSGAPSCRGHAYKARARPSRQQRLAHAAALLLCRRRSRSRPAPQPEPGGGLKLRMGFSIIRGPCHAMPAGTLKYYHSSYLCILVVSVASGTVALRSRLCFCRNGTRGALRDRTPAAPCHDPRLNSAPNTTGRRTLGANHTNMRCTFQ